MKDKKLLVFDMDGTIADFYSQENWLEDIRAEKVTPYKNARPLVDMNKLVSLLNKLKDKVEIAIVTWGSKTSSKQFLRETAKTKREWLEKYDFPYDRFHCTSYGYSKRYPVSANRKRNGDIPKDQVLFDDNPEVRADWEKWENNKAVPQEEMLDYLTELVKQIENENEIDFHTPSKVKENQELYMVLDCETATLPFVNEWNLTAKDKQKISIAKPLIYDIGWRVVDKYKNIYSQHSFLIQETFFVPNVFNTAYYNWKRPLYMNRYKNGNIKCVTWEQAVTVLKNDLEKVKYATAYNAMFDFKKAIPFTDNYMYHLYDVGYSDWEKLQKKKCKEILENPKKDSKNDFDQDNFELRGRLYPIADIWGISCERLINKDDYRLMCLNEGMISASGLYFKTSAETSFRYLAKDSGFEEEHTALSDAIIETDILCKALEMGEIPQGIKYFPFKDLGYTVNFMVRNAEKITQKMFNNVLSILLDKINETEEESPFFGMLYNKYENLIAKFDKYYMNSCMA